MRFKLCVVFISLLLFACSDDNSNPTYPFEKTVLDVSIVKRCKDGSSPPGANCYLMRWQHPIEKKDLKKYYIWLDTLVLKDSVQDASQPQKDRASSVVPYSGKGNGDSLDLTDMIGKYLERDSLHIAILAEYAGGEQGAVKHFYVYFGDDIPPSIVHFSDSAAASAIWIKWTRPTDQRDFYFPDIIDGPIAGYNVSVRATDTREDIRNATVKITLAGYSINTFDYKPFSNFEKVGRGVALKNVSNTDQSFLRFAIIDGNGFSSDNGNPLANNWQMEISGLKPERSYNISIVAFDSAGNASSAESRSILTTDAIPPLIASKFWLYADAGDGLPRLDSNRLILFWPRSVDPLTSPTQIKLDSVLDIPANCYSGSCYREVKSYMIEQWNSRARTWENIPRISAAQSGYYYRYTPENGSMKLDLNNGKFITDTLRWVLPGDTIVLRMRAIDSSGHYSKAWIDTIAVSKGALWQSKCPPNYAPVKMGSDSVFCMEKLQHTSGNRFIKNVLHIEAKRSCEALSGAAGFENFTISLCSEQQWNAACNSGAYSYGVIEERDFGLSEFLYRHCGVGTDDTASAYNVDKRSRICSSPDGIRDLPGQLQEWVTSGDSGKPLLKGTSYITFEGASRVELAQCKNRFTPVRTRPRYTTNTVWIYKSGSRIDTLFERDISRERDLYDSLPSKSLPNTILRYELRSLAGDSLGIDYFDLREYNQRGKEEWLKVRWQGLSPKEKDTLQAFIQGEENIDASNFFLDPTAGFRCCAKGK